MSQNPTTVIQHTIQLGGRLRKKAQSGSLGYFALMVTSMVWGTTWVASKIGIQGIHPLFFSAIRQTLGGSIFLLFFLFRGKAVFPNLQEFGHLLLMAFLLFVASNGLTTWGIKYISSGLGSILGAIFPLVVALIDWFSGHKSKPNLLATLGLLLGFAGVAIIFYEYLPDFANPDFRFGILISLLASITWSVGTIITSRKKTSSLNRYYALGWQMFLAGCILHLISFFSGLSMPYGEVPAHTWKALAYMVTFGSIIAFGSLVYSLHHLPAAVASLYAYFNPMVAVIAGHFILGEKWSLFLLAGAVVTLAGVFLVNLGYRREVSEAES